MAWAEKRAGRNVWLGYYRDAAGKKHYAGSGASKKKALDLARDEEARIRSGVWHDPNAAGDLPFGDYFLRHRLPYRNSELSTRRNYLSHFNCELQAAFGETPLKKINHGALIQQWVLSMQKRGLANSTVRSRFRTVSVVLGADKGVSAVRDQLLPSNPCKGTTLPPKDRGKVQKYEVEEIERLIEALDPVVADADPAAHRDRHALGQMLGLTVDCFSKDFTEVEIRRTIIRISKTAAATQECKPGFQWKDRPETGTRAG